MSIWSLSLIDLFELLNGRLRVGYGSGSFRVGAGMQLHRGSYLAMTVASFFVTVLMLYDSFGWPDKVQACVFLACTFFSAYLWNRLWRLYHYIADTATSRAVTAAQGLVELHGTGDLPPGQYSQGISMGPPCLWQSYTLVEDGRQLGAGVSTAPFQLQDSSGTCTVYPEGATVISSSRAIRYKGRTRVSIHYLKLGADIYVLGELRAVGGDNDHYNLEQETIEVLRKWKIDQRQLVADYDRDGDGRIDAGEWEAAYVNASKVAEANIHRKRHEGKVVHEVRKPSSGLPLIISDKDPVYLEKHFYWLGTGNLLLAVSCFVMAALKLG